MDDKIYIKTLGKFSITYGQNTISDSDNRSKKIWILLEYLITNHTKELSQSTLVDLFWTEDSISSDPENALKTSLHRVRSILSKLGYTKDKLIIHKRNTFSWNSSIPFQLDVEEFERFCHASASIELSVEERLVYFQKAFQLYQGDYLPKAANEDWAFPIITYYHSMYVTMVHDYCTILESLGHFTRLCECCQKAFSIEPYDELIYYYYILGLHRSGKPKAAMEQYMRILRLFYDNFGINPSQQLTDLYQEITSQEQNTEADLNIIQTDLREQNAQKKAYFCDYSVFRNLYQIEARSAERSGLSIFLLLITLDSASRSTSIISESMDRMSDVIATSLRSGDIYSRFSKNQYIILLPTSSFEDTEKIGERIIKSFTSSKPKLSIKISFNIKHLEPQLFT